MGEEMTQEKCGYCGIENSTVKWLVRDDGVSLGSFCELCKSVLDPYKPTHMDIHALILNIGNRILEKLNNEKKT